MVGGVLGTVMVKAEAEDTVEHTVEPILSGGGGQEHLPAEGADGARHEGVVVADRADLFRTRRLRAAEPGLVVLDEFVEVREAVLLDGIELPDLLDGAERARPGR